MNAVHRVYAIGAVNASLLSGTDYPPLSLEHGRPSSPESVPNISRLIALCEATVAIWVLASFVLCPWFSPNTTQLSRADGAHPRQRPISQNQRTVGYSQISQLVANPLNDILITRRGLLGCMSPCVLTSSGAAPVGYAARPPVRGSR